MNKINYKELCPNDNDAYKVIIIIDNYNEVPEKVDAFWEKADGSEDYGTLFSLRKLMGIPKYNGAGGEYSDYDIGRELSCEWGVEKETIRSHYLNDGERYGVAFQIHNSGRFNLLQFVRKIGKISEDLDLTIVISRKNQKENQYIKTIRNGVVYNSESNSNFLKFLIFYLSWQNEINEILAYNMITEDIVTLDEDEATFAFKNKNFIYTIDGSPKEIMNKIIDTNLIYFN